MYTSVDFTSKIVGQRGSHTPIWCLVCCDLKNILLLLLLLKTNVHPLEKSTKFQHISFESFLQKRQCSLEIKVH
jgi:hypothetical protein